MCSCVFRSFLVLFLAFSLRANAREFKQTLVFQCLPFDELLENVVSSRVRRNFLVFSGTVSSGGVHRSVNGWKIARIRTYFLAFSCTSWDGVFGCFSVPSASIVRSHPFPVRTANTKYIVNSKNMIYLMYSAVYYLQMYNYSHKIRG